MHAVHYIAELIHVAWCTCYVAVNENPFTTRCPSDANEKPHITGSNKDVQIWRAKTLLLLIRNPIRIDQPIIPLTEYSVNSITAR